MTIAFTGSRPDGLYGYDRRPYRDARKRLLGILGDLYDNDPLMASEYFSGGAQGADQLAFWTVESLRKEHPDVVNRVIIPFSGQEESWPWSGLFSRTDYESMLNKAASVTVASESRGRNAYFKRNGMLADKADLLIAIAMHDPSNARTGTGNTVRQALLSGTRVSWWDPESTRLVELK